VVRAEDLLRDPQGPLVQGPGCTVVAGEHEKEGEVVEAGGHIGVVWAERLIAKPEGLTSLGDSLRIASLLVKKDDLLI